MLAYLLLLPSLTKKVFLMTIVIFRHPGHARPDRSEEICPKVKPQLNISFNFILMALHLFIISILTGRNQAILSLIINQLT